MPRAKEAARGGVVRYRTICPHGKAAGHCKGQKITIAVVRKRGPRGGRTVASRPKPAKGKS